jgi:FAD/FMN-containing dehydrogenase
VNSDEVTKRYESWGRFPKADHCAVEQIQWRSELPDLSKFDRPILPFGYGRSYGDTCLNNGGILLDTTPLRQLIAFDKENGILQCEAGVTLAEILDIIVPHGWFIPVSPGTKFVSVAGAIANDVHGKNHHVAGTFGCHVTQFELLRSSGEKLICSPTENQDLFCATIGGLGLTGLILWAEFKLKSIPSPLIDNEIIRFGSIDEFFEINEASKDYAYTVSWIDCLATGKNLGRGLFTRGDFYDPPLGGTKKISTKPIFRMPIDLPNFAVNTFTVKVFNEVYYRRQLKKHIRNVISYDPFFYPLDVANDWNRAYGRRGFMQYQCVVPYEETTEPIVEIIRRIAESGQGSPLVVLKTFGNISSPGMLSFPRPGITLALDFANGGQKTFDLLEDLDSIVRDVKGAIYPAKDARMSFETFNVSFPNWREFANYIDPKFSSSFWRRIMSSRNGEK